MSEILPLSSIIFLPFSDFYRAPSGTVHFLAIVAVIKWKSNHETYQWTVHYNLRLSMSNCALLGFSINTTVKLLSSWKRVKISAFTNTLLCTNTLSCYCVSCDEFCQVQYIENVTILPSTCCFSVPGYLYIQCFAFKCAVLLLVLYTSQPLIRLIIPYMY